MGKKIKTFAKIILILGISVCLIASAHTLSQCYNRNGGFYHLRYATINGGYPVNEYTSSAQRVYAVECETKGNDIYFSIQLAIYFACGAFGCLLYGLPVYWLGCLFERTEATKGRVELVCRKYDE